MSLQKKAQIIVYIGRKPIKHDTVAGTGLIWAGYGDSHEVPHTQAVMLMQHPDVWVTDGKFKSLLSASEPAITAPTGLTNASVAAIIDGDDSGKIDGQQEQPAIQAEGSRELIIKNAIIGLDRENPEHFSEQTGNPIIKAVRDAAGDNTISLKEVNAAWSALKAGNK